MVDRSAFALTGKRIVVTRAESQSAALAGALRRRGAEPIPLPLIRIAPPQDFAPLDSALRELSNFDWLIFTSQNSVAATAGRLSALGHHPAESVGSFRIAAVGKATAEAAHQAGFSVAYIGEGGTAADLVRELAKELRHKRVLLARGDRAAAALITQFRNLDANVTEAVAYRTFAINSVDATKREAVAHADAIFFFSPSAVNAFLNLVKSGVLSSLSEGVAVGAIGPVTHTALREAGVRCDFQAHEASVDGIVVSLAAHFAKTRASSVSGVNSR